MGWNVNHVGDISDRPVGNTWACGQMAHLPHKQTEVFMGGDTGPCTSSLICLQNIGVEDNDSKDTYPEISTTHRDLFNESPLHATVAYSINKGWG